MKKDKKSHGVQLLLRMVVKDPDGKVITDTGRRPSHSFLIQFLEFVYGLIALGTDFNATDILGAETPVYKADGGFAQNIAVASAVAEDNYGVVIGTGDTAEDNLDYKLETQLTEGSGAGEITHNECTVGTTAEVGANVDLEILRAFSNGTGSTITVKESGIYAWTRYTYYHCLVRDVLPAEIEVPDKCSLTVIYTFRTTV